MEIISKILYFLLAAPVIFLLVRYSLLHSRGDRIIILFLHAIVLTLLTVFLFNQPFWSWSNQIGLLRNVTGDKTNAAAYQYVRDHFILVDNSYDKELVLNPEGDEDDSTTLTITSRARLTTFLHLLNSQLNTVDLVVCDIGFDLATGSDTLLQQELLKLSAENKLLLSIAPNATGVRTMGLRENVFGRITDEGAEKLYVTHTIKQNGFFSLPYKLYAHLNGIQTGQPFLFQTLLKESDTAGGNTHTVSNTFFPDFFITDEELLKGRTQNGQNSLSLDIDAGNESNSHAFYYLSEPLSAAGAPEFRNNLVQRKKRGQTNIIFLGTFSSPTEDVHQTIYKDLHGPTILLNIFYALQLKRHYLTFSFVLILLIGYSTISWVLIYHSLKLPFFSAGQKAFMRRHLKPLIRGRRSFLQKFDQLLHRLKRFRAFDLGINMIDFLIEFVFVEALHLVLLITLIFIIRVTTGQLINGMSLLIYLAMVNALLKYARRYIDRLHAEKEK